MNVTPVFIDTDIGDDVDDALALTVALHSPEIDLRGVSTVFRDAPRRALLARHLLDVGGDSHVPVYAGCSRPLVQPFEAIPGGAQVGRQFEVLEAGLVADTRPTAVVALRAAILEAATRGEKLTLVGIGPFTNLALLLHTHPDLVPLCRVVIMGGRWNPASGTPAAEWNISCDPEAAAMLFGSGVELRMVGLDVTQRCALSDEQIAQIGRHPSPRAALLVQLMARSKHPIVLHDPLTVLSLSDDCVRFEPSDIQIGLYGAARGLTEVRDGAPNCEVAVDVDVLRAVTLFMECVLK